MKEQWKKVRYWFLMSLLTTVLIFMPMMIFFTVYCITKFLCHLVAAIVVSFDCFARPYVWYSGTAVFITLLLTAYLARDIANEEYGSIMAAAEIIAVIFLMPIPLITGLRVYRKGKKEEAEMLQNGGDYYGE